MVPGVKQYWDLLDIFKRMTSYFVLTQQRGSSTQAAWRIVVLPAEREQRPLARVGGFHFNGTTR